jgi:hypothetical protein
MNQAASRRVDPGGVSARRGSTPPLAEICLLITHGRISRRRGILQIHVVLFANAHRAP